MPVFYEIEEALRGLAASRDRQKWLTRRRTKSIDAPSIARPTVLPSIAGPLTTDQALAICQDAGIPTASWHVAPNPKEAARRAVSLGFPVALKILAPDIGHKSDVGGVVLGLSDIDSVERESEVMLRRVQGNLREASRAALLVQQMVSVGTEVILGGKRDPSFGPVVMFGLGGVFVEAFRQVAFRVAPLTQIDAEELIDETQGSRLLAGYRGAPPADREALIHAILAFSQLLVENPRITELEINPLLVLEKGIVAVDARAAIAD